MDVARKSEALEPVARTRNWRMYYRACVSSSFLDNVPSCTSKRPGFAAGASIYVRHDVPGEGLCFSLALRFFNQPPTLLLGQAASSDHRQVRPPLVESWYSMHTSVTVRGGSWSRSTR